MKRQITLYFIFLFTLTASAQELLEKTITVEGLEREYLLYVPAAYDGSEDWPLMFNLHGASSNPEEQLFFSGMNAVADTGHFLVAYPLGIQNADGFEGTGWNARLLPDFQDDVLFINNLIDTIAGEYSVDLARVYACGMSNGGGMSYTLSCTLPGRIAAIATVASPGVLEDCDPQRPFPYLYIHGTEDTFAPFNGGQSTSLPQLDIEFPAAYEQLQSLLERNGCTPDSTVIEFEDIVPDDNSTISVRKFTNCDTYLGQDGVEQPAEVWFYVIENGGHVWPGVSLPPGFGNSNLDVNASVEIWNFFSRHSLPRQSQLLEKTITIDSLEREYLLYVPAAYDGTEEWPLVFSLHGSGSNAQQQYFIDNFASVADTAHFLVAYPEGILNVEGLSGWNVFSSPDLQDDVAFISQIIDATAGEYQLDLSHIYSTGLSNGAGMSVTLSNELSDRIAAIATVAHPAGLPSLDEFPVIDPGRPFPILVIHGTADLIVPFAGGQSVLPDIEVSFPNSRETIEYWVDFNGCGSDPSIVDIPDTDPADSSTVTLERYTNCDASTEIAYYIIENGGHTWPDGPAEAIPPGLEAIFGNINRDINASSEIWNFFNRHELSEPTTGVEDGIAEFDRLSIFPNPATASTQIRLTMQEEAAVLVTLRSLSGSLLLQRSTGLLSLGNNEIDLDLSNVPNGAYFLVLTSRERVSSSMLVVSKNY